MPSGCHGSMCGCRGFLVLTLGLDCDRGCGSFFGAAAFGFAFGGLGFVLCGLAGLVGLEALDTFFGAAARVSAFCADGVGPATRSPQPVATPAQHAAATTAARILRRACTANQ